MSSLDDMAIICSEMAGAYPGPSPAEPGSMGSTGIQGPADSAFDELAFLADMFPSHDLGDLERCLEGHSLEEAVAALSEPKAAKKRKAKLTTMPVQDFHRQVRPAWRNPSVVGKSFRDIVAEQVYVSVRLVIFFSFLNDGTGICEYFADSWFLRSLRARDLETNTRSLHRHSG